MFFIKDKENINKKTKKRNNQQLNVIILKQIYGILHLLIKTRALIKKVDNLRLLRRIFDNESITSTESRINKKRNILKTKIISKRG